MRPSIGSSMSTRPAPCGPWQSPQPRVSNRCLPRCSAATPVPMRNGGSLTAYLRDIALPVTPQATANNPATPSRRMARPRPAHFMKRRIVRVFLLIQDHSRKPTAQADRDPRRERMNTYSAPAGTCDRRVAETPQVRRATRRDRFEGLLVTRVIERGVHGLAVEHSEQDLVMADGGGEFGQAQLAVVDIARIQAGVVDALRAQQARAIAYHATAD